MYRLLKKLHIYTGLLTFSILAIWGVTGISATFHSGPQTLGPPEYRAMKIPPGFTDSETAAAVHRELKPPLAGPVPNFAIKRNKNGELELDFYSINGMRRVTVLESESRLRIENRRVTLDRFLNNAHTYNWNARGQHTSIRLWSLYSELSIWSLLFLSVTGVYLWLSSRPGLRWAQVAFAAGNAAFAVLYFVTR